jgi:hypothetical protein
MTASTPNLRLRGAIETGIRLAAPGLDLLLAVGDRVSRVLDRQDRGYATIRLQHEGESAPRGIETYRAPASASARAAGARPEATR